MSLFMRTRSFLRNLFASRRVEADIEAEELTINGEASGNIDASSKVAISASAKVAGDIKAPRVVIEDGAVFNGSIEMEVNLPDDI